MPVDICNVYISLVAFTNWFSLHQTLSPSSFALTIDKTVFPCAAHNSSFIHPNHEKFFLASLANTVRTNLRSEACFCRGNRCHAHVKPYHWWLSNADFSLALPHRRYIIKWLPDSKLFVDNLYVTHGRNINPRKWPEDTYCNWFAKVKVIWSHGLNGGTIRNWINIR